MGANSKQQQVEIHFFSFLRKICDEKELPYAFFYDLQQECSAGELAQELGFPEDKIEAAFINGLATPLEGRIKPGDRVAFIPPGTPGPYRALLGMVKLPPSTPNDCKGKNNESTIDGKHNKKLR